MDDPRMISRTPPRGSEGAEPGGAVSEPTSPSGDPPVEASPATPPVEPTPATPTFTNPMLAGRSPEEIERLFDMQQQAIREQGGRLTQQDRRLRELEAAPTPPREPEKPVSAQDFFNDPMGAIRGEMDRQITPLRDEVQEAKRIATAPNSRAKLATEFGDWGQVEPYIDMMLSQQEFPDPNDEGVLRMLYFTAKGAMAHQGISTQPGGQPPTAPAPATPSTPAPSAAAPVMIPQHGAAPPPAPPPAPEHRTEQVRELTEHEKRLAREAGLTAEQYLKWQEMDMEDVAEADFDIPQPKEGQ